MRTRDQVLALERAAFDAWQAEEIVALGPWRLRFMQGVTDRANSVWAGPGEPPGGFDDAIARVEAFYAERRRPVLFQITPAADELDARLAARGYERYDDVSVQIASAARVAQLAPNAEACAQCDARLSAAWFELSGRRGRFRGEQVAVYRAFLERVAPRAGFASARPAGATALAAVGLTLVAPPLAGVFSMLTLPEQRGRGLAAAVLAALARFAAARGAAQLYLQVSANNAAARALYSRAGFSEAYRYHYRRRAL
ncbi:MAG TPA: GNAT family N-acetyltransferase [Myxococcota bacterium]|nr:GNAT family N-acetyltransferase [Myxococcota bacterium]